jgi:hypothetical protein
MLLIRVGGAIASSQHDAEQRRNASVIRQVFGRYGDQAVNVADCESHLRTWARNGQYLGMFQMGSYARAKYGHHWTSPWHQAKAAYHYFRDSGRDWSPWDCKP